MSVEWLVGMKTDYYAHSLQFMDSVHILKSIYILSDHLEECLYLKRIHISQLMCISHHSSRGMCTPWLHCVHSPSNILALPETSPWFALGPSCSSFYHSRVPAKLPSNTTFKLSCQLSHTHMCWLQIQECGCLSHGHQWYILYPFLVPSFLHFQVLDLFFGYSLHLGW